MELDRFSYLCGAMDAFAELVHAGVKQLALSHPCASLAERDALLPLSLIHISPPQGLPRGCFCYIIS